MKGKIVLITGASGGLGEATATAFAQAGAEVIMLARNPQRLEAAAERVRKFGSVTTLVADLADPKSVRAAADKVKRLDVLVNNAGIYKQTRSLVGNHLEAMFATNHLGPFLLTTLLLDKLRGGRILNVAAPSTTKLDFADLQGEKKFSAFHAFGASKMCNLLTTYELARRQNDVRVVAFHPGLVKSELMSEAPGPLRFFLKLVSSSPQKPAAALVELARRADLSSGKFFTSKKEIRSSDYSHDPAVQKQLWDVSEQLVA
jgi:NAD(P)-dependent dehydrogenase (short-subunit alcohol dehydrogenase family)